MNHLWHRSDPAKAPQAASQAASSSSSSLLARPNLPHIQRYGLTVVYEPSPPSLALVDVVFVHGLSGDPQKTWTSKNTGTFWPSQLLPQQTGLQNTRIWTYGYNADPASREGASKDMIHDHSEDLVQELAAKRAGDGATERPIIFIAHSLGGLVVKRALVSSSEIANEKTQHLRSVFVSTVGIIFLGTPHKGSDLGAWGSYLEWLCHAVVPKKLLDTQPHLVNALKTNNETLQVIENSFTKIMGRFQLFYFYEALPTDIKGTMHFVVDKDSAAPNLPGVERAGIQANHSNMCKFDDSTAPGFAIVADAVSRYASEAPQIALARWLTEMENRRLQRAGEMLEKNPEAMKALEASRLGSPEASWHSSATDLRNELIKPPGSSKSSPLLIESQPRSPEPIYFVPPGFRENAHFVGRDKTLEELDQHLFDERRDTGTACVLLYGQAGVGKSSVARQYVTQNRHKFPGGVFWLNAYLLEELEHDFWMIHQKVVARFSREMLAGRGAQSSNYVEIVREWFQSRQEWLIVLDGVNVETDQEIRTLRNFIPDSNNSSLVYVSRPKRLATMHNLPRPYAIKVPPLSHNDARKLLFLELQIDKPRPAQVKNADKLVDKVGSLPLGISAIARRIDDTGQLVEKYHLKSYANDLDFGDTFQQIIEDMKQHNHGQALNLMAILCFLGPHIPVELVQLGLKALKSERVEVRSSEGDENPDLNTSFAILMRHALLERNEPDENASSPADSRSSTLSDPDPIDMLKIPLVVSNFFAKTLRDSKELPFWLGLAARLFVCSFREADQRIKRSSEPPRVSDYRQYLTQGESLMNSISEQRPRMPALHDIREGLEPVIEQIKNEIQDRESQASQDSAEQLQFQKSVFDRSYSSSSSARSEDQLVPPNRRLDPPPLDTEHENEFGIPLFRPQSESPKSIEGPPPLGGPAIVDYSPPVQYPSYCTEYAEGSHAMEKDNTSSTVRPYESPPIQSPDWYNASVPKRRIWRQGTGLGSFRPVPAVGDVNTQHALGSVQPRPSLPQRTGSAAFDSLANIAQSRASRQPARGWSFWPARPSTSAATPQPAVAYPGSAAPNSQPMSPHPSPPSTSQAQYSPPGYQLLPAEGSVPGSPTLQPSVPYPSGVSSAQAQSFNSPPTTSSPLRASVSAQELVDGQYAAPAIVGANPNPLPYSSVSVAPMSYSSNLPYPASQPPPSNEPRPRSRSDVTRTSQPPTTIQALLQRDASQMVAAPVGYYSQPVSRDTSHQSHGSGTATEPPLQMPFSPPPGNVQPVGGSARARQFDGSPLQKSPKLGRAVPAIHHSPGSTPPQYQGSPLAGTGAWVPISGAASRSSGSGGTPPTAPPMGRHGSGPGVLVPQGANHGLGIAEFGEAPGPFVAAVGDSGSGAASSPSPAVKGADHQVEEVGTLPLAPGLSSASLNSMARGSSGGSVKEAPYPDKDRSFLFFNTLSQALTHLDKVASSERRACSSSLSSHSKISLFSSLHTCQLNLTPISEQATASGFNRGGGQPPDRGGGAPRPGFGSSTPGQRQGGGPSQPGSNNQSAAGRGVGGGSQPAGDRPYGGGRPYAGGYTPQSANNQNDAVGERIHKPKGGGMAPEPDTTVTNMENALLPQLLEERKHDIRSLQIDKALHLPLRPAYNTLGRKSKVWANYMNMVIKDDAELHYYDLSVSSQDPPKGWKLQRIIRLLLDSTGFAAHRATIGTDFRTTLISLKRLPPELEAYQVTFRGEMEDASPTAPTYTVQLALRGRILLSRLIQYLSSTASTMSPPEKDAAVKALNVLVGHHSKANRELIQTVGNKVFWFGLENAPTAGLEKAWTTMDFGLQAVRGLFFSCRPATGRMLLNINVAHGAFYDEGPLKRLIDKRGRLSGDLYKLESFLKKLKVDSTHWNKRNKAGNRIPRVKTVVGLARESDAVGSQKLQVSRFGAGPTEVTFYQENKQRWITIHDFFFQEYRVHCDAKYPVVKLQTPPGKPSVHLPVELCEVIPRQHTGRKLEPPETEKMVKFATRRPALNARSITGDGAYTVGTSREIDGVVQYKPLLEKFGMHVPPNLITAPAQFLECPLVMYQNGRTVLPSLNSWNLRGRKPGEAGPKFAVPGVIEQWSYMMIYKQTSGGPRDLWQQTRSLNANFMQEYQRWLRTVGIEVRSAPTNIDAPVSGPKDKELEQHMNKAAGGSRKARYLIVFIPAARKDINMYQAIKRVGDRQLGIHTMCVLQGKVKEKMDPTFFTNMGHKLNLKVGGRNHGLGDQNLTNWLSKNSTMVMGVDVTHPLPGSMDNAPSVGAVVASVDRNFGQWPAFIGVQTMQRGKEAQEMLTFLYKATITRLQLWKTASPSRYPDNIIVYRDGVSESQYHLVLRDELTQVRKACNHFYPENLKAAGLPRITVVVIGKRHHTRFYPTHPQDADNTSNVKNGLVVDRGVTEARVWDFFLVPHVTLQGTVKPVHCIVLLDEVFSRDMADKGPQKVQQNAANKLIDFTHQFSYIFGRCTRAVSLCPPAYYADLACERARAWLARCYNGDINSQNLLTATDSDVEIHPFLANTMFYT